MDIPEQKQNDKAFLESTVSKELIIFNVILAVVYFLATIIALPGNPILFGLVIFGSVFYLWQLFTYLYTVWNTNYVPRFDASHTPSVDVFITVAGEPVDIVEQTVKAALAMRYPDFKVYVLNDGFVAKKDNWRDIEIMTEKLGAHCITRSTPGGAKAGNINHGIRNTSGELIVVFDADHVPHSDFLEKTVGYFIDPRMGYVQSPQFYKNMKLNQVTQGSWEQQALFFGPICKGKNRLNSATMCGTNMIISRKALAEVGNVCEYSIAEDFLTGLFIHQKGWKSFYVAEVLAEGLAPEDFLSYYKQQARWARGALDVLFKSGFLWKKGLTLNQKIQYLSSASYFVSGFVVLLHALIPIIFFYTGFVPLVISTMTLAALFLPYIFVTIYTLQSSSNFSYSFRSLAFSMAGFNIHIGAFMSLISGKKATFAITSKRKVDGNFIRLVIPQIVYIVAFVIGVAVAVMREGLSPSVISNFAWSAIYVAVFFEFIRASLPQQEFKMARSAKSSESMVPETAQVRH